MSRKKLICKLAIPAAVIFLVSILVLLYQIPYRDSQAEKRERELKNHVSNLTQQYQKYLSETASKITSVPADPKIIGDTQSKILQERTQVKLYLWMIDNEGEFVFGSPATTFAKMNAAYDRYKDNIEDDGHFLNRNEFLENLIAYHDIIDFSEFESKMTSKNQVYSWRFYSEGTEFYGPRPKWVTSWPAALPRVFISGSQSIQAYRFLLSSPVTSASGEVIGQLFLKIDDSKNKKLYNNRHLAESEDVYAKLNPIFGVLTFFSGLFLWFLLPTWVYTDARQRDARSPGLWAFLTLISLFFGLTIYLITRPSTYKSFRCPECENELNGTNAFCPHCGFDLAGIFCPQCQYPVKQSWQFCPNCRAGLGDRKEAAEDTGREGES